MNIREEYRRFRIAGYYNGMMALTLSVIAGLAFALFPFQNLSLAYVTDSNVLAVGLEAMLLVLLLITGVMYVSYRLDQQCGWHDKLMRRILLQLFYGGIIPFALLLGMVWALYSKELFAQENIQFLFAVYVLFLFTLNRHGYIIYVLRRKSKLKRDAVDLEDKLAKTLQEKQQQELGWRAFERLIGEKVILLEEQVDLLREENSTLKSEVTALLSEKGTLKEKLAGQEVVLDSYKSKLPKKIYEIKFSPTKTVSFSEDEIAGFVVAEQRNKKPMIELFAKGNDSVLTNEASLADVHRKFPAMIRLNRQYLVAQDQVVGCVENTNGTALVSLGFSARPVAVSRQKWKELGAEVRNLADKRNRHQNPSPDAGAD